MKIASLRQLCAAGLWAVSGLALAQTVVFSENFDAAGADAPAGLGTTGPAGWTLRLENAETVATSGRSSAAKLPWLGWKFVTPTYWTAQVSGGDRAKLTKASGKIAVAESDGLRPTSGLYFSTVMESPSIAVLGGGSYTLGFLNHFQMGSTKKESIKVEAVFDDSSVQTLLHETSVSRLNQNENLAFSAPAGAKKVNLRFSYLNTDNNWYWGLDDVVLTQTSSEPPKPFDPAKLPSTANAPALTVGPTLQNPGPDHMAVMLETSESAPTIWWRLAGSTGPYTLLAAKNPVGDFADSSIFFADIAGLQSNTLYEYAVVTGTSAAPKLAGPFQFKTWPRESDGVNAAKFAVVSDTQDGLANRLKNITQGVINNDCAGLAAQCAQSLAGFMVPGDLVGSGGTRSNWKDQFFGPLAAISAYVPLIPSPGNHEYFGGEQASAGSEKNWAKTYRKYFNRMPANGSEKHPLHWYQLDYLGMRIVGSDFNPASAMHNTGGWTGYDNGRGLFRADYMQEHLNWFSGLMAQTRVDKKPYMVLLNHHPCLSEKWRQGEVMATCDFISQLEDYGRTTGAITANLNGHVHFYERGNSMNSRHLWLNVASGSGALEGAKQDDDSDLDVIANTKLSFGYGTLEASFGSATPALTWKRYDLSGSATSSTPDDSIAITSQAWSLKPELVQAKLGKVDPASLQLAYRTAAGPALYEAQWQVSKDPQFAAGQPVYDVWGNDTRSENWTYLNGVRVNTQKDVDIATLPLGQLLANPKRVYPNVAANTARGKLTSAIIAGGNSLRDRWSCGYKWDEDGDSGAERQGGRQCYAQLANADGSKGSALDPFQGQPAQVLQLGLDERWYWRVRVRDTHLNWSDWSATGSFELGNPAPEPEPPVQDLIDTQLPTPGGNLPAMGLNIQAATRCDQSNASISAVPAGLLPAGLQAASGVLSFTLSGCDHAGFSAQVRLELPSDLPANSRVMKVHTAADGQTVVSEIAGASIAGGAVRYSVTDGGPLDEDGLVNGTIVDPVLVAVPADVVVPPSQAATPVPTNQPLALLLVSMLLMAGAALARRQR